METYFGQRAPRFTWWSKRPGVQHTREPWNGSIVWLILQPRHKRNSCKQNDIGAQGCILIDQYNWRKMNSVRLAISVSFSPRYRHGVVLDGLLRTTEGRSYANTVHLTLCGLFSHESHLSWTNRCEGIGALHRLYNVHASTGEWEQSAVVQL
jgi:hypothetical protein